MIQEFDLIYFCGSEPVSKIIRKLTSKKMRARKGKRVEYEDVWSHVAIVVSRNVLDIEELKPEELYVIESTMSGSKGDGVCNISGEGYFGVQLRSLSELLERYQDITQKAKGKKIGVARMSTIARAGFSAEKIRPVLTAFWKNVWSNQRYDFNPISLLGSMYTPFRPIRSAVEKIINTDEYLFCSELVATILRVCEIIPETINPKNVLPMDLVGYSEEENEQVLYGVFEEIVLLE